MERWAACPEGSPPAGTGETPVPPSVILPEAACAFPSAAASFTFTCLSFRILGGAISRTARAENTGSGFPWPKRLKLFERLKEGWSHVQQVEFRVDIEHRLEVCRREPQTGVFVEMRTQLGNPLRGQRKADRVRMAAIARE
jgi:hypothetical protein